MNRALTVTAAAALVAAAGTAIVVTQRQSARAIAMVSRAAAEESAPIYFQDPDGKPAYSLGPRKTQDGRDYRPVPAGGDVGFDEAAMPSAASSSASERRIKYYRNPMGLPDTSPVPKRDSMGMDYIAVYEGDDTDDGSVKLSPGKIQRTGAKSEPAVKRVIRTIVRAPGTIALDERRISVISMRSESFVLKVADVTTGSHVVKGQPLMDVYIPAVVSAAAEYLATINSKVTSSDGSYGRGSRQRLMNLDVPESAIAAIEKGRGALTSIEWTAPRDGIVLERNAIEGMRVQPGGVMFRIADHSVVWALIDVAERDLGTIAVGQTATVKARSFPGREFTGKVGVIYPEINKETRTARIRVELANPGSGVAPRHVRRRRNRHRQWRGGPLRAGERGHRHRHDRRAVISLIDKGQGRFEPREVKLGRRGGGYVEVRQGVADGEPVVVSANFLIDAESNLKAALKGFSEGAQQ